MKIKKFLLALLTSLIIQVSFSHSVFGQSKSENKMGDNQFKMIQLTYGLYENDELLSVVKEVGQNLEKHLGLDYKLKYHLVDLEEPNAFATAGGYVYVTRGLLALLNTKDELACVLGHELTHVTQRHNTKKKRANILPAILEIPANIVGLLTTAEVAYLLNLPIEATFGAGLASYSRSMEKSADKIGIQVAAKAGYDPYALGDILARLESYVAYLTNQEMKKSIYLDHPITPKRVKSINKQNQKNGFERKETKPGTKIMEIEDLIFGQNPMGGIIKDSAFIHPTIGLYCEFPPKWQINNSTQSITALSPKKDAVIMVSSDKSSYIDDLVKDEIKKYKGSVVVEQKEKSINGLTGYSLILDMNSSPNVVKRINILWLDMPDSKNLLKVQAIAQKDNFPSKIVEQSYQTFRVAKDEDYALFDYSTIELVKFDAKKHENNSNKELLDILNGIEGEEEIPSTRYLKTIKKNKLIDFSVN